MAVYLSPSCTGSDSWNLISKPITKSGDLEDFWLVNYGRFCDSCQSDQSVTGSQTPGRRGDHDVDRRHCHIRVNRRRARVHQRQGAHGNQEEAGSAEPYWLKIIETPSILMKTWAIPRKEGKRKNVGFVSPQRHRRHRD
jgi:hypothetical protein